MQQELTLPILITREMNDLIDRNDPCDPIGVQFLPNEAENTILPQELKDSSGDYPNAPLKALVHRHASRILLKPTMVCAVYCRFCFRREMVGPEGDTVTQKDVDEALEYIAQHPEIKEVIFTGGDPLMLSPKRLKSLMEKITAIPHIRWIRLHTRIPIVATHRITDEMLDALKSTKAVTMAVHTNHAREITPKVQDVLAKLAANGVILLGQSVLLKGVNDNKEALIDLLETLMANRVKPYYLHHPGLTAGTSHFRIPLTEGMALMNQVQQHVSGVCLPQYTLDIPGGVTKIAINPYTCQPVEGKPGHYTLHDPMGGIHNYSDVIPKA